MIYALYIIHDIQSLILSIEAKSFYNISDCNLVIIDEKLDEWYLEQEELIDFLNSTEIFYVKFNSKKKILHNSFVNMLNKLVEIKYNKVFISNSSIFYRRILANIHYQHLCLISNRRKIIKYTSRNLENFNRKKRINPSIFIIKSFYLIKGKKFDKAIRSLDLFTNLNSNSIDNVIDKFSIQYTDLVNFKNYIRDGILTEKYTFLLKRNTCINEYNNHFIKSLEEKKYISLLGDTYIYPTGLFTYTSNYQSKLIAILDKIDNTYIDGETDLARMEKIKRALIFIRPQLFEKYVNEMLETFTKRMKELLSLKIFNYKRFEGLLNIFNQLSRLLYFAEGYFIDKRAYFVTVNNFYLLYEYILKYRGLYEYQMEEIQKKKISSHIMWIFAHYAKTAAYYSQAEKINKFLYENRNNLLNEIQQILFFSTMYAYYKKDCYYELLLKKKIKELKSISIDKIDAKSFYFLLKSLLILEENIDSYYKNFINMTDIDLETNINILGIFLDSSKYYSDVINTLWALYTTNSLSRKLKFKVIFLIINSLNKEGNILQARRIFNNFYMKYGCRNTNEAKQYISTLESLGLLFYSKNIFYKLYFDFIFKEFYNSYNVDIIITFLDYQKKISKLDKLSTLNKIYVNFFQPKVEKMLLNKKYKGIFFINPALELNNFILPLHIYNLLLDNGYLIYNIELSEINFFNYHLDELTFSINRNNDALLHNTKHWNSFYNRWEFDYENQKILCNDINIFQGIFEQISRTQKKFSIDYESIISKKHLKFFIKKMDRNMNIFSKIEQVFNNTQIAFISITGHYTPWSSYRDATYHKNNSQKISFVHVTSTYENYLKKMQNTHLETICALNLTKFNQSRVAAFGSSELCKHFINKHYDDYEITKYLPIHNNSSELSTIQERIQKEKKANKVVICLLGKIVYDLAVPYMSGTFKNIKEWVQETSKFVTNRDDIFMLVKPHPHELNYSISQVPNEYFTDFLSKTSNNIYNLKHDECSLNDLIGYVDLFILWNGTSVIELAQKKQNIMVCDDWAQNDYPIGLYQPKTPEDYFKRILACKQSTKAESDFLKKSQKKSFLFVEYMKNGNFFNKNRGIIRSSTNIDWDNTYIDYEKLLKELKFPEEDWNKILKYILP